MGSCYHAAVVGWLLLLGAGGCRVTPEELQAVPTVPDAQLTAPPPAADAPAEERLFQVLYAGESGDAAFEAGQRARVRAWLRTMPFRPVDLTLLADVVGRVRAAHVAGEAEERALAEQELAALGPVYAAIEARYAGPTPPTEDELAAFAAALSSARVSVYADQTPASLRQARVRTLLDLVAPFVDQLPDDAKVRLSTARFFLARRASPFGRIGAYHALVGLDWDGGEFAQLDETEPAPEQPQMDVGGLWALEKLRAPPGQYLSGRQLQAIVVMASLEPALAEALGVPEAPPEAPPASP